MLGFFPVAGKLGINQANGLDYTVRNGQIVRLEERARYVAGSQQSFIEALRYIADELGIDDQEVRTALGGSSKRDWEKSLFDPIHLNLPDANLLKAEVISCAR